MCIRDEKVCVFIFYSVCLLIQVYSQDEFCQQLNVSEDGVCATTDVGELSICDGQDEPRGDNVIAISHGNETNESDTTKTFKFCVKEFTESTVVYFVKLDGNIFLHKTIAKRKIMKKTANRNHNTLPVVEPVFLIPGNVYNIRNNTYKAVSSDSSPVTELTVSKTEAREIELRWTVTKMNSWVTRTFEIFVNDLKKLDPVKEIYNCILNRCQYTIKNLKPFTRYDISVKVKEYIDLNVSNPLEIFSGYKSCIKFTKEVRPLKVLNYNKTFEELRSREVSVTWSLPEASYNAMCVTFKVDINGTNRNCSVQKTRNHFMTTITHLIPGSTYTLEIYAINSAGPSWNEIIKMPVYRPPHRFAYVRNAHIETCTTVTLEIEEREIANYNGNITYYSIVVSNSQMALYNMHDGTTLPTWHMVQKYESWPPYEIKISRKYFGNYKKWNFTIGNGTCSVHTLDTCNGPLKPDTLYYMTVRAYTADKLFRNITKVLSVQTREDNTLLLAILGVVCALAVTVWVALLWWCGVCQRLWQFMRGGTLPTCSSRPLTTHPVRLQDFPTYVRTMLHDTPEKFTEEFGGLSQVGREQPCTAAHLPCNLQKNRFINILPYDHSRFKLQPINGEDGSDYINANFVPGFHSPKDFIATQGPMFHTRYDFWRMCWESNAGAIVMLTRCVEKNMDKCDHYWPDEDQPISLDDFYIATLSSKNYCNWTISEYLFSKGGEKRTIYHFRFIAWPDFGVPNPPSTLVQFVKVFREHCQPGSVHRPTVIHCSAGVGRSGTFIALDRLMLQLHSRAEYLDVLGLVHGMRRARPLMVQTEQQYVCIHACIASLLDALDICRRRSTVVARPRAPAPPPPPTPPRVPPTKQHSQQVHYNLAFEGPKAKPIHS